MVRPIPSITLSDVISDSFRRKGKKAQDDIDKLKSWFENYYDGGGDGDILQTPLQVILADPLRFTAAIEAGLRSFPNDKQAQAARLSVLLKHISGMAPCPLDLDFLQNFTCRSREERLLRMLKYLHSGNKSRADIAATFGISERALSDDLKILQDGFEFMGCTMRIRELERGSNTYTSLIHPLFLAMRTDEVFALTVGLKLLSQGTVFEHTFGSIADTIYQQLSPPAQAIIDEQSAANSVSYGESDPRFINSYEMMMRIHRNFAYYLKDHQPCAVHYMDGGKEKVVQGAMHFCREGEDRWQKITMINEDESTVINVGDVLEIRKG